MKIITLASTILITGFVIFAFKEKNVQTKQEYGINFFNGTWQQAIEKAKKENKFIFFDAYASWCGPCKMMKKRTFSNKEVGDFYNKNFICLAIDMEKGEGPTLANKFKVEAYPTLMYFKSDGKMIAKEMGFRKANEFIEMGKKVINSK
jgi:thiol:disulfide interchange protein